MQQNGAYLPNPDNDTGCPPVPPDEEPGDCVFVPGGQLQTGGNFETMGSVAYQHIFSSDAIGWLRGMARDNSADFSSNPASWPLIATQHNYFNEIYFNGSVAVHHGRHEWKAGVESDNTFLHENFSYRHSLLRRPLDPQCPINLGILDAGATTFAFTGNRPDLEQSAYVQDAIPPRQLDGRCRAAVGPLPIAGEPECGEPASRRLTLLSLAGLNIHGSYDRIFQTPSFENILLSSSPEAEALDTTVPISAIAG